MMVDDGQFDGYLDVQLGFYLEYNDNNSPFRWVRSEGGAPKR